MLELVEVHDLRPRFHEVRHKRLLGVIARVVLGDCAELRVGGECKVDFARGPGAARRRRALEHGGGAVPPRRARAHGEQVDEEVVGEHPRLRREHADVGAARGRAYVYSNVFLTFDYFWANFERPDLGCIEAEFCKSIPV